MIVYTLRQVAHWMSRVSIQKMRNTTRLHLSRFNHISATAAERLRGCTWAAQHRPSDVKKKKKKILPWNFALPRLHATASGCMKALSLFKSTQFRVGKHVQPIEDAKKRSPPLFVYLRQSFATWVKVTSSDLILVFSLFALYLHPSPQDPREWLLL